jgi:hypothetical protein
LERKPRETSLTQLGLPLPVNSKSRLLPLHSIGQRLMPLLSGRTKVAVNSRVRPSVPGRITPSGSAG